MKKLRIDIETRSSYDIGKVGVYKYAEAEDFEILLFGYSVDDDPALVVDVKNGEEISLDILCALMDPQVEKWAFNAQFERVCIDRHFGIKTPVESWHCTSVLAASYGLPASLALCASALKLTVQKMKEGKGLIKKFCEPAGYKTGADLLGLFGDEEAGVQYYGPDWELFKQYCAVDVDTEAAVAEALRGLPAPPMFEHDNYVTDQKINDRGVAVNLDFAEACIALDEENSEELEAEAIEITGLQNPKSPAQLKEWISRELGVPVTSLNKKEVDEIDPKGNADVTRILELRKELSRSSTAKYRTMIRVACRDSRLRGMFRFVGAPRTGRWSSKFVQLQNLPNKDMEGLEDAITAASTRDVDLVRMVYGGVSELLTGLIRPCMVAAKGKLLVPADYSSIEARILSWLAGEEWRLKVFAGKGKIYEAAAAAMFRIPVESITKGSPYRAKGKIAELSCGYGGGKQALINMGALKKEYGLKESELQGIVTGWRNTNPKIVRLWKEVNTAMISAVKTGEVTSVTQFGLRFALRKNAAGQTWLFVKLPSGRYLGYFDPVVIPGEYGDQLSYMKYGNDDGSVGEAATGRAVTYGAKMVENIVQAIARDCLAVGLWRCERAGFPVVMHVHDEIVPEVPAAEAEEALKSVLTLMAIPISWAPGLLLGGEGFVTPFYRK